MTNMLSAYEEAVITLASFHRKLGDGSPETFMHELRKIVDRLEAVLKAIEGENAKRERLIKQASAAAGVLAQV